MSIKCVHQVALDFVGGGSDKVYVIQVQEQDLGGSTQYEVVGYYGRRGSTLSATSKYKGPSLSSANGAAVKLEREKSGKGYNIMPIASGATIPGMPSGAPVFGGASAPSSGATTGAAKKPSVGIIPMLANVANEDFMETAMADPSYAVQPKYDGERCIISLCRSGITATNRKGEARPLSGLVMAELTKLLALPDFGHERKTVVDGEIMGDTYVIYDVMTLRDVDVRKQSFDERFAALEELLDNHPGLLAPTAWTEAAKRAMLAEALANDWEGLMFRQVALAYSSGRTNALMKYKLWATCTCRVLTANTQRSIQVALVDAAGKEVFVGNVTVPSNQEIPEPDGLVEVRYLYALDGGSLYQPTLLGVRDDITEADKRADLRKAPPEKRAEPAMEAVAA